MHIVIPFCDDLHKPLLGITVQNSRYHQRKEGGMRAVVLVVFACTVAVTGAIAAEGTRPSDAEVSKIKETLAQVGCASGEYIKEPSGLFEIDDATCKIGQYDMKLDKDFNITLMSRD